MSRMAGGLCGVRLAIPLRCLAAAFCGAAFAQKKYDVGATDTEIKIGNIVAYGGPVSSLGVIAKIEDAYFQKDHRDDGGINGRRITFISYDDAYSPPKSVEQAPQARGK